ncbi:MAG: ABC transporter ATP-binding protein [Oscillospiraceae bacterium]
MSKIIEVSNLNKSYGHVHAVKDLDFYVESGRLYAFLGPNGAGKTTTIDIICTFLKPDSGTVVIDSHVLGEEDDAIRRTIGVVFQDGVLDNLLTVRQNLSLRGGFCGLKGRALEDRINEIARIMGLAEIMKRPYGKLSGGQRRRCDIARALLNTPKILFLDEPTTGLDPQTRKSVWEVIKALQKETGMSVFLTTHYMEEADGADYVLIIDDGEIVARGTPSRLKEEYSANRLTLVCIDMEMVTSILGGTGLKFFVQADRAVVSIPSTMEALPVLERVKDYISGFEVKTGDMDDTFLAITGKEIRE